MPLSLPVQRQLLHTRAITIQGYVRDDALFDIEAHLVDTKAHAFTNSDRGEVQPGIPLHEMWLRLTLDIEMEIRAVETSTDHGPFHICGGGGQHFSRLVGLVIRPGFLRAATERVRGVEGCTHLRELLQQVATTAFQTMWSVRMRQRQAQGKEAGGDGSVGLINSCFAYDSAGPVVQRRWPERYTGQ